MVKSATSVQIGEISIDLNLPMPVKEQGECQHNFSIRGYTAEMRKKDKKICSPFGSSSKPEEQLPPLDVPKFKWWLCDDCIREVGGDESAGDEIGDVSVHTGSTAAATHILTKMKFVSEPQNGDGSKAIMDDSVDTSDDEFISSWKRNKPICNVVGNKTAKAAKSLGDGTELGGVRIEEIGNPVTEVIVSKQCSSREIEPKSPVANVLNNSTNSEPIPSNDGNDKVVPDNPEKEKGSRHGQRTASNTSDQIEVLGNNEKVLNMSNVKLRGLPSLGSRKGTETSKGSDANLAENRQGDLHEDITNNLPRRKTPKVRLITDLLGGIVNLETSCANAERFSATNEKNVHPGFSSSRKMVASESDTVVAPKDMVSVLEDLGKGIRISQKKRNMSQEDRCKSGMNLDGKMGKRLKALNQNQKAERSPMEIEVTDSRRGENGPDREQRLLISSKSVKINKHKSDKDSGVSRKKHKQTPVFSGYFLQMPLEGKNIDIGTNRYGANILFQSSPASTSTGKVERHLRNDDESLHGKETDSGLNWNSNKLLEVRHALNVAPDKNLQRESSLKEKAVVQMPIGTGMVTHQPEKELSIKEKLDLSLSSFRSAQKHVENDTIKTKSTTHWPLNLQKGNKSSDPLRSNGYETGQSSRKEVNSLIRQSNVFESGQSSRKEVNSLVRQPINVSQPGQSSRKGVSALVRQSNLSESGQSSRKGAKSLFRRPHVPATGKPSREGVNPLVRQQNVAETGQSSRKGVILDLNQGIAQTPPMWKEIQSSPNLLQRGNLQIRKSMETPRPSSKANLNEVQGHSYVVKPQKDHQLKKVMEKGPSDIVSPMNIVEMLARNQYERNLPQTQSNLMIERNGNGGVRCLNPGSTSFYPVHANINADVGALRGNILHLPNVKADNTEMAQVQEMKFKLFGASTQIQQRLSNRVQVSAPVPTRRGLQHVEGPKPVWFPAAQNILFEHGNPQNYVNQSNNRLVLGKTPGLVHKGRTISDIKTVDPKSSKKPNNQECSSKGFGSSNSKERPFSPCNNHPLIIMDGNQSNLFNGSFLSYNHSPSVYMGGYAAGQSSHQPVPYFQDQVSLQPQGQEKKSKSHAPSRLGETTLQQSSGLLRTTRAPESREIIGASSSKVVPLQSDNTSESTDVRGCSTPVAVLPISSILEKDPPCLFNQNPTDIMDADDEKYMRTIEDQKCRDKNVLRENSGGAHLDGPKRQRRKERPGRMPLGCRAS